MKMTEVICLNLEPPERFALKGHNLKEVDIVKAINIHEGDDAKIKIVDKYETWAHWVYGYFGEIVPERYCMFKDEYKGVRGGFPITVITGLKYLDA